MTAYVDLVCAEICATTRLGQQPLQTVSFGGGVGVQEGPTAHSQPLAVWANRCLPDSSDTVPDTIL